MVNDTDPRVAAIILACNSFVLNGTLPAGSSLVQCTELLNFKNVTFIEGGDVVFNLTATADGVPQQTQQVTMRVDNTPSLTLTLNSSQCAAPASAGVLIGCWQVFQHYVELNDCDCRCAPFSA